MSEFEIFSVRSRLHKKKNIRIISRIINYYKNLNLVGFVMSLTPQRGEIDKLQVGILIYMYVRV